MIEQRLIVVAGATGRQGGAVVRHLLDHGGWRVRGLTRDPDQPVAQDLAARGVEMVRVEMDDPRTLLPALRGAHGVFSVQNYWEVGYDREVLEGKNLADAAEAAHVQHLIYSSVGSAERQTGLAHFDSKYEIEEHVRLLGLRHTIFRPVFFMDNFLGPDYRDAILSGTLPMGLPPETKLQMVAVDDVGAFVTMAFAHPDQFQNRALEIAGDELTMPEAAEHFARVLGRPVRFTPVPIEQIRQAAPEWAAMLEWFVRDGYRADIPALRQLHPGLLDFDQWLRATGWERMAPRKAA